jgi:hypothetical protein
MEILAHRGIWSDKDEQNSLLGLEKAIVAGFGVELDVRDYCGRLVLSHDIADDQSPSFVEFLNLYSRYGANSTLAINIKSDGLATMVSDALGYFGITANYFCFDMSVPEQFPYLRRGLLVAQRVSPFDFVPTVFDREKPAWVDSFGDSNLPVATLDTLAMRSIPIACVSTELHGREHTQMWCTLQTWLSRHTPAVHSRMMLCTDFPYDAEEYFNGRH